MLLKTIQRPWDARGCDLESNNGVKTDTCRLPRSQLRRRCLVTCKSDNGSRVGCLEDIHSKERTGSDILIAVPSGNGVKRIRVDCREAIAEQYLPAEGPERESQKNATTAQPNPAQSPSSTSAKMTRQPNPTNRQRSLMERLSADSQETVSRFEFPVATVEPLSRTGRANRDGRFGWGQTRDTCADGVAIIRNDAPGIQL
jgi:hypothetical protein